MSNFLIEHALSNVWCAPEQDNQFILKLSRISHEYGVWNRFKLQWIEFGLPVAGKRFHIFQIGEIHPALVNFFTKSDTWIKISDSMVLTGSIMNLYTDKGVMLPRFKAWYIYNEENVIYIAVQEDLNIQFNYGRDDLYLRAYRNAFFSSTRSSSISQDVLCSGIDVSSLAATNMFQSEVESLSSLQGDTVVFCNGFIIPDISPVYVKSGDTLEYVHDSSLKRFVDYKLSDLLTFDSTLDSCGKYLLHYDKTQDVTTIEFSDDIDLYLVNGQTNKGVYIHKNDPKCFRSLTHRDYSLNVSILAAYLNHHNSIVSMNNAYIRMHVHNSGYERALVYEDSRIKELYKLSENNLQRSMLGMDSTVTKWRADSLESSFYSKIMSIKAKDITKEYAAKAYGFNAIMKYTADSPIKTEVRNSQLVCPVPFAYRTNSTAFEYDQNGTLINSYAHSMEETYVCRNPNVKYVEFLYGTGSDRVDEYLNTHSMTLLDDYDYRFYVKQNASESSDPKWSDVTGSSQYAIVNKVFTWLVDSDHEVLIRSNKQFLLKSQSMKVTDGIFQINISSYVNTSGSYVNKKMFVPMGHLDVFLNGNLLIRNLDYYLDFPYIKIVNKSYFIGDSATNQKVLIRHYGLCTKDLKVYDSNEKGFIRNNVVSNNTKYNIHEDKVIRVSIDGKLYSSKDVKFNEDGDYFVLESDINGKPYQVIDAIAPMKYLTSLDSYSLYEDALSTDKQISDYLTLKLPEVSTQYLNPIKDYHYLFSPFIHKVMQDCITGAIDNSRFSTKYNDSDIMDILKSYMYLLPTDPTYVDNMPNSDYVKIVPHCYDTQITLTVHQYSFILRVNKLLCNNLVQFAGHVMM